MPLPRPRNSAEQVVLGRQIMPVEKWREILKHETRSEDGQGGPTGTGNLLDLYPEVNPAAHSPSLSVKYRAAYYQDSAPLALT